MKLLFYIHGLTGGGAERVMAILMNAFIKEGHSVRVIYTYGTNVPKYELDKDIEQVYLNREENSTSLVSRAYKKIYKYYRIRKEAKTYNPDVAISFIRPNNNEVLLSLLGSGIPVVIGDHTNINRKYPLLMSLQSKILYPHASAITMLTKRDYNIWKEKYKNVYYIPNPCDIPLIQPSGSRKKIVLAAGRVNQWHIKGFDNLMRAWSAIKDDYPEWKCQIAGDYTESALSELRSMVTEEEFNSVEFLGFRSDIHELMTTSEIFCLSSRIEGMPMVLLEALSLGCACISYDCISGPSEMIEDGKTGVLVKDQSVEELSLKLGELIANKEKRESFRETAPASITRFSINNILVLWNQMFKEITRRVD